MRVGGGLVAMAVLYAVAGPIGLAIGGWFAFSPDPMAATGRSGGTGALAAGGRAAGAHLLDEWRRGAPTRKQRRTARRDRWWDAGGWRRRALSFEHGLIIAWRAARTIAPALWPAGRRGAHALPGGWRRGVSTYRDRRRTSSDRPRGRRAARPGGPGDPAGDMGGDDADPFGPIPGPRAFVHDPRRAAYADITSETVHDPLDGGDRLIVARDPQDPLGDFYAWAPDGENLFGRRIGGPFRDQAEAEAWMRKEMPYLTFSKVPTPGQNNGTGDAGQGDQPGRPTGRPGSRTPGHPTVPGQATPDPTQGDSPVTTTNTAGDRIPGIPGTGELETTRDLRAEVEDILSRIAEAEILAGLLRDWQTELPDRYQAAPDGPRTRALSEAVDAITSAGGDAVALGEAVGQLRRACDQADSLGEQANAMGADGHTKGFVDD
jgi:hypothetical protein